MPGDEQPLGARELERLRAQRVRPSPDFSLKVLMDQTARDLRKKARAVEGVGETWEALVPDDLRARTAVQGVSRGVMTVRATDSATKYAVEVLLRGGLEREVIRSCAVAVRRVRVVVGGSA